MTDIDTIAGVTPTTVNSSVRTREYLTAAEIDRLMTAARSASRYGHRDATMILIGYRHGLRASEVCDLQWSQVELNTGRLHVRRAKNGSPSVHPLQGDEIRALRRLQREQGLSAFVFMTERGGPMTPKAFRPHAETSPGIPLHPVGRGANRKLASDLDETMTATTANAALTRHNGGYASSGAS
jgi:integrase